MKHMIIISLTLFLFVIFSSCEKEKTNNTNVIRPLIAFTTSDIPTFNGMTQVKTIENSFFDATKIIDDSYSAKFEFKWESDAADFAYFDIRIMEDHDKAFAALTEMHIYYANPFVAESIDEPAKVGDISYMEGREFIRNNLIIRIHTSDNFDDQITEIANYIDSKILKSPSFISISNVKPIINDFKIENNPLIEDIKSPLIINTTDPNDQDLIYQWRFDRSSRHGDLTKDDSGNYYYTSPFIDLEDDTIGLTLIIINKYGFCADSTIYIKIIEE